MDFGNQDGIGHEKIGIPKLGFKFRLKTQPKIRSEFKPKFTPVYPNYFSKNHTLVEQI